MLFFFFNPQIFLFIFTQQIIISFIIFFLDKNHQIITLLRPNPHWNYILETVQKKAQKFSREFFYFDLIFVIHDDVLSHNIHKYLASITSP